MTRRFIEEQATIILDHLRKDELDPTFLVEHAELILGYALCMRDYDLCPQRRQPCDRAELPFSA